MKRTGSNRARKAAKKFKKRPPKGATKLERSCTLKLSHPTEMVARIEAQKLLFRSKPLLGAMWVYPCNNCGGWHVTSSPSRSGPVTMNALKPVAKRAYAGMGDSK